MTHLSRSTLTQHVGNIGAVSHFICDDATPHYSHEERSEALLAYLSEIIRIAGKRFGVSAVPKGFAIHDGTMFRAIASDAANKLAHARRMGWSWSKVAGCCPHVAKWDYIYRLVMALRRPYDPQMPHISLEAEAQWGKTIVLIMSLLIHKMWLEINNRQEIIVLAGEIRRSINQQTSTDYENALGMHAPLAFADCKTKYQVDIDAANSGSPPKVIAKTTEDALRPYLEMAKRQGAHVKIISDEADVATSMSTSILSRWVRMAASYGFTEQSGNLSFVVCTCTSFPWEISQKFYRIVIDDVPPEYSGMFTGGGNFRPTPTPYVHFGQLANATGIDLLADFDFNKHKRNRIPAVVAGIMSLCRGGVSFPLEPAQHYSGYPLARLNGKPMNGGKGIAIRYGDTKDLLALHERLAPVAAMIGVTVLLYFKKYMREQEINGVTCGYSTVQELVDKARNQGVDKYIILVAHSLRRGDRLPNDCTVFFEFCDKFSNATAAIQAGPGRMSGWDKINKRQSTVVVMSKKNYDFMVAYRDQFIAKRRAHPDWTVTDCKDPPKGRAANRMVTMSDINRDMVMASIKLSECGDLGDLFKHWQSILPKVVAVKRFRGVRTEYRVSKLRDIPRSRHFYAERAGTNENRVFINMFPGGEADIRRIEDHFAKRRMPVQLVRPGKTNPFNRILHGQKGFVEITVGNINRGGHASDASIRGDAGATMRGEIGITGRLGVACFFEVQDETTEPSLVRVTFPLAVVLQRATTETKHAPHPTKNIYAHPLFIDDNDREQVEFRVDVVRRRGRK